MLLINPLKKNKKLRQFTCIKFTLLNCASQYWYVHSAATIIFVIPECFHYPIKNKTQTCPKILESTICLCRLAYPLNATLFFLITLSFYKYIYIFYLPVLGLSCSMWDLVP